MLREEEKDQGSSVGWKTFSRSVSWTERPPRKSNSNSQWNSKARACLSPLQPLSIARPSIEEWPRAGSDDLGVWPDPPTPGARPGSKTPRGTSSSDLPPREFKCRKDKLAFFDKECSRILDHIYLGSDVIAKNREILRQRGITHVLNCVGFVCPEYFRNELVYKTLWLQDSPSEDITSILYDVFDYFEDIREQGGRVLVHCCHGVSRSTSLVIAYLMWKEGQSFDDAFQHVKTARGVTNPNVGFACQLLQCQKRVHALPASPTSVLRMYRMAPHSPYDPLHLVPKMLCEAEANRLDSRGAFIIHIPSALYIWIGKHCSSVMSDNARAAASQIIRYERFKGPVMFINEGEETVEFWDAFGHRKGLAEGCHVKPVEINGLSAGVDMATAVPCLNQRKLDEYDLDFDIFHMALSGGVIPPCPSSETGSETCIPSRENGWNRLRSKFTDDTVKEFATDSVVLQGCDKVEPVDMCSVKDTVSSADISSSSSMKNDSKDPFASCVSSSLGSDASLVDSPPFNLVDSFSSFFVSKTKSNSTSPSISPSTSDYSSSFSFSPSSSNLSDSSFVSAQPSPHTLESSDSDHSKRGPTEESLRCVAESTCLRDIATSPLSGEATSPCHVSRAAGLCSSSGQSLPSLAERRGSSLPSRMILASIDEESHVSENFPRFLEDDAVKDVDCENSHPGVSLESTKEEPIRDANGHVADVDCPTTSPVEKK
ncbi:protein-tyrosine-phosphatase MKP1-like [Salvia hispanica]|uniref:protein-tyrosine-phosphatase MKP1-like n=1 Tax=Salvia hispanica TaxID=49212 RepID=UPI002008F79E|nr:protein-tyrosine-phosphatase MKP1-like [Salvia hispanica]